MADPAPVMMAGGRDTVLRGSGLGFGGFWIYFFFTEFIFTCDKYKRPHEKMRFSEFHRPFGA